jgi:putative transcriptional regulator
MSQQQDQVGLVEQTFNQAGFDTIRCDFARFCFDILANKATQTVSSQGLSSQTLITKVITNIDSVSEQSLLEIRMIAKFLHAIPLIIGKSNRRTDLEDQTIYYRDIIALSLKTLENLLIRQIPPYIIAKRGSFIANIDGNIIKNQREQRDITRKELSELLNVSVKTISDYERGIAKSNLNHIKEMERVLETHVTVPINIFRFKDNSFKEEFLTNNHPQNADKNKDIGLLEEISELFEELGINQYWTSKSPFDVLLSVPKDLNKDTSNDKILPHNFASAVFSSMDTKEFDTKEIDRLNLIRKLMDTIRFTGTAIVNNEVDAKQCKIAQVPVIEKKELKEVRNPKELKKLFIKRN